MSRKDFNKTPANSKPKPLNWDEVKCRHREKYLDRLADDMLRKTKR